LPQPIRNGSSLNVAWFAHRQAPPMTDIAQTARGRERAVAPLDPKLRESGVARAPARLISRARWG
jgi:hypothetical protein